MTIPGKLSKPDDRSANRNKIRHQLEREQQDRKIMQNMLKVLILTLALIALAVFSVSDGFSAEPVTHLSTHQSI